MMFPSLPFSSALLLVAICGQFTSSFVLQPLPSMIRTTQLPASTKLSPINDQNRIHSTSLHSTTSDDTSTEPQVFATGYSSSPTLLSAILEATSNALLSLPPNTSKISLAQIYISSLYDGQSTTDTSSVGPSDVIPILLQKLQEENGMEVEHVLGCSTAVIVGSNPVVGGEGGAGECTPVETEGLPGVCVTLAVLPDVQLKTFHVMGDDVPEELGMVSSDDWKNAVGLRGFDDGGNNEEEVFMLLPSPSFQNELDNFLRGLTYNYPQSKTFGGIASTVSSLSRARLFRYSSLNAKGSGQYETYTDGCVGIIMKGDVQVKVMIAQGAKPVGGIYRIVSGGDSTIGAIVLDEAATEEVQSEDDDEEEELEDDEDEVEEEDEKKRRNAAMSAAYAKARIPKPILAEANFLMRTLSDDDQAFMRRALLIGLERGGSIGRTPNELMRLAAGEGHRFTVHQVASAGMKDGSVTLPLGSVDIEQGTRLRFFVRDGSFAKREVDALWMGYKKTCLGDAFLSDDDDEKSTFTPSACMVLPTMDRGAKLFGSSSSPSSSPTESAGYESSAVSTFLPTIPSISGFYANAVLGKLDESSAPEDLMVHGSSSCYAIIGSKTKRPTYSPRNAAIQKANDELQKEKEDAELKAIDEEDTKRTSRAKTLVIPENPDLASSSVATTAAPRSEDGELIIKRREVHSGRAISVSTVEWSVAEKTAVPTSALEGFMWDKEAEVDRFRERIPLANLLSQVKISMDDPGSSKPRDWIGPIKQSVDDDGNFIVIPECKRMEPTTGSLRKRYNLPKLVKQFTYSGVPAISVNCDGVLFGGSLEDITAARDAASSAAAALSSEDGVVVPPILASDLILYPYQLYKLRLAGADAVNLVAGALTTKDLLYLTKICKSLQLQVIISVSTKVQIQNVMNALDKGSFVALVVSNRDMETFGFDESGGQAVSLLESSELAELKEKFGDDLPVFVEGRVGMIDYEGDSSAYIQKLKDSGAFGAIVGGGLAMKKEDGMDESLRKVLVEE